MYNGMVATDLNVFSVTSISMYALILMQSLSLPDDAETYIMILGYTMTQNVGGTTVQFGLPAADSPLAPFQSLPPGASMRDSKCSVSKFKEKYSQYKKQVYPPTLQ